MAKTMSVCPRCGQSVSGFSPHLRTVMALNHTAKELRAQQLAAMENATQAEAQEWLRHYFHAECVKRSAACPRCGGQLVTARARWCPHCQHSWFAENADDPAMQ